MNPIEYIHDLQWSDIPEHVQPGITNVPWQPEAPPSDEELIKKYNLLANDKVSSEQADEMQKVCLGMSQLPTAKVILELLQ